MGQLQHANLEDARLETEGASPRVPKSTEPTFREQLHNNLEVTEDLHEQIVGHTSGTATNKSENIKLDTIPIIRTNKTGPRLPVTYQFTREQTTNNENISAYSSIANKKPRYVRRLFRSRRREYADVFADSIPRPPPRFC